MEQMIDYDLARIRGIAFDVDGVLSASVVPLHPSGEPLRMVNVKDGYALQLAVKHGLQLAIISGADTQAIRVRFESLGVQDIYLAAAMKLPVLQQWMAKYSFAPDEVAYVGDDIPDLQPMQAVGLAVAPADAAIECRLAATYVSPYNGGYGVGRDLLEQVMRAQGLWLDDRHAFGW